MIPRAILLGVILGLIISYLVVAVTGSCKDSLGGPVLVLAGALSVILAVGLIERCTEREGERP